MRSLRLPACLGPVDLILVRDDVSMPSLHKLLHVSHLKDELSSPPRKESLERLGMDTLPQYLRIELVWMVDGSVQVFNDLASLVNGYNMPVNNGYASHKGRYGQ